jgi:DNA replication and repair protein RecF
LSRLVLARFRNYCALDLPLHPGIMLFAGANAQGKTNLLEAVYLLATLRSPRTENDAELVSWGLATEAGAIARIYGRVERRSGPLDVEVQFVPRGTADTDTERPAPVAAVSRRIRVNGVPKRSQDATGLLNAVFFSTLDIDLVTGSPSVRRRYLDLTLTQVDPGYRRHLGEYAKVMAQRNALLKRIQERLSRPEELDFWDEQLLEHGAHVFDSRAKALESIGSHAALEEAELTRGAETLTLRYLPRLAGIDAAAFGDADRARAHFATALAQGRRRDIEAGMTLQGPHRDDFELLVGGVSAGAFGSRAQQRTAALAMRLAEARFLELSTGEAPVLLLDDILSEMDPVRRTSVLARLDPSRQLLVTTAEPDVFPRSFVETVTAFGVDGGTVSLASH